MLEQRHLDGEGQTIIADMGHSIDTMSSMLSSLLDINRLETGNLRPSRTDFVIGEVFDSVAIDFCRPIEEKRLQCRLVQSRLVVQSDRRMLVEMIRNLLSNAVKFTAQGTVELSVRSEGECVELAVRDTRIGWPALRVGELLPTLTLPTTNGIAPATG